MAGKQPDSKYSASPSTPTKQATSMLSDDDFFSSPLKAVNDKFSIVLHPHLGVGAFGVVYKAVETSTKKKAAAKEIKLRKESDLSVAKREIETMSKIHHHDNIVQLLGSDVQSKVCWLFLEYCDLGNLSDYLEHSTKKFTLERKLNIMYQTARGLAYMHGHNPPVIHRDIKPENILFASAEGSKLLVKLADFGLSKVYDVSVRASKLEVPAVLARGYHTLCGTPAYLAPELYPSRQDHTDTQRVPYTMAVDVFSLGLVYHVIMEYTDAHRFTYPVKGESRI